MGSKGDNASCSLNIFTSTTYNNVLHTSTPKFKTRHLLRENSGCLRHSYRNSLSRSAHHQGTLILHWGDSPSVCILHEHYMHSLISMIPVVFNSIQIALHKKDITCQQSNYWCLLSLQQMIKLNTSQVDNTTAQTCMTHSMKTR